jgi:hypothetical protein
MSSKLANAMHFDAGCEAPAASEAEPAGYQTLRASIAKKLRRWLFAAWDM